MECEVVGSTPLPTQTLTPSRTLPGTWHLSGPHPNPALIPTLGACTSPSLSSLSSLSEEDMATRRPIMSISSHSSSGASCHPGAGVKIRTRPELSEL